jgi:ABC-2 type transport system permease protein
MGGASVSNQAVPAGTIYDRGYRHYEGPREGRGRRVRAIVVAGVRRALGLKRNWKTKVVPFGLLVLAFGPVFAFIGVRVLVGEAVGEFLGYGRYLRVVAGILLLFAATAGPELLCPDRRQNVLALIFTRPVTRLDYLLAKLAALLLVVGLIAVVPLVVLFIGNTLTAEGAATYLREHLDDLGRILLAGVALTVFYSVVALAAASLTDRRALATAGLLGVLLGSSALANILFFTTRFDGRRWFALVSLGGAPMRFVDWVFGDGFDPGSLAQQADFTGPAYLAEMAVIVAVAGGVLAWRVLRLRP